MVRCEGVQMWWMWVSLHILVVKVVVGIGVGKGRGCVVFGGVVKEKI